MTSFPTFPIFLLAALLALALYQHAELLVGVLTNPPQIQTVETVAEGVARLGSR